MRTTERAHDRDDHSDPTLYRTPADAVAAPPEKLAYVVGFDPAAQRADALFTVGTDPESPEYGRVISHAELPGLGNELHHFGWNACSSALAHAGHHHAARRYLIIPGLRSSRLHIFDTGPDPARPRLVKVVESKELADKAEYSRPHTLHCGPDGVFLSCLGGADGADGPGGVALLDHESFEVLRAWESDRGPQRFAYDLWWHLRQNIAVTSEWGTPSMYEDGLVPELLLDRQYGHSLHFWELDSGRHLQRVDLGDENQMVLELRPAHDPEATWGFAHAVVNVEDLSASVWLWNREGEDFVVRKVITISAEPAQAEDLPPALQPFGAVPPLITDIDLSVDDQWLYVSTWGTGDLHQYDVSDPFHPRQTASVRLGGIASRQSHPAEPDTPLTGGAQMVELSRDGRRVYLTNSLYSAWDAQFYPAGIDPWMVKLDADTSHGGLSVDSRFYPHGPDFLGLRVHQTRLQGGDASSDSYCYRS
ncbi:selenium-binding protein [Streptomyces sp. S1A1-8]|uniref:selenium-binding protein SBP56-related protein n=1 Tax=unclassified Streptomyces TaxID=2593676 RepID=UPI001165C787|nr:MULTISPECIES: selenium-binding protein SBP56-related protein [unclassified Streptomyces]QDO25415.1 selenium-binding protein [Streptomyces sp. S1A1-8]QDO35537.1 selenium-binding protein [Streptomyces sp. S1A1-3]